jgi:hypothetical protein
MSEPSTDQQDSNQQQPSDRPIDPSQVADPRDLVYSGGFDRDPQEILGNPAVAPPMLSEGRDLRVDIFREAEDAAPGQDEN